MKHRTGNPGGAAERLAERIQEMVEVQAGEILKKAGAEGRVCGIGAGWRNGDLALIVQPATYEDVPYLRAHLPDRVNDFAVSIEMEEPADVARSGPTPHGGLRAEPHRRIRWWRRFLPQRDWLVNSAVQLSR